MKNKYTADQITSFLVGETNDKVEKEMISSSAYRYAECLNYFDDYLSTDTPLTILDLGTGKGWMALLIKKFYPHHSVTACDVSVNDTVRSRFDSNGINVVTDCIFEAGKELPLETAGYDACVFFEVLEHIIADPRYIFSEIARFVKPDGRLFFTCPNLAYLFSRFLLLMGIQPQFFLTGLRHGKKVPRNHFREWTMAELVILLEDAGFTIEDKGYLYGHGGIGVAKKRLYLKPLLYIFKLLLVARPSFRGVVAMVGRR